MLCLTGNTIDNTDVSGGHVMLYNELLPDHRPNYLDLYRAG